MGTFRGPVDTRVPPRGRNAAKWALLKRIGVKGGDGGHSPREGAVRSGRGRRGGRNALKRDMAALLGAEGIVAPPRGRWAAKGAFPGLPGARGAIDGGGHRADGIAPMAAGAALRAHADTRAPNVRPRPTRAQCAPAPYLLFLFLFKPTLVHHVYPHGRTVHRGCTTTLGYTWRTSAAPRYTPQGVVYRGVEGVFAPARIRARLEARPHEGAGREGAARRLNAKRPRFSALRVREYRQRGEARRKACSRGKEGQRGLKGGAHQGAAPKKIALDTGIPGANPHRGRRARGAGPARRANLVRIWPGRIPSWRPTGGAGPGAWVATITP